MTVALPWSLYYERDMTTAMQAQRPQQCARNDRGTAMVNMRAMHLSVAEA